MDIKLTIVRLLSSLLLGMLPFVVAAHEVSPSIGDFSTSDGQWVLELRLNLESFVAEIDLDGISDTNETGQSGDYDSLRALAPDLLAQRFKAVWPEVGGGFHLRSGGADLALQLGEIKVGAVGDIEVPRTSFITLRADLVANTTAISFGWDARFGTLVLRQNGVEDGYTGYLSGGERSPDIAVGGGSKQSGWQVFTRYSPAGFDHILPKGLDHILFVLGLFFLSTRLRPLLWQITAFTLAHTVTLALGAVGWVSVSPSIVEPLIAASITYVAIENIFTSQLSRWRPLVIFGFGLLHGLGFAAVLGDVGLPDDQFFAALIGFNIGVEFGQVTVISLAFLAVGVWFRDKPWYRARIAIPASVVIAVIGAYWFIQRVFL
ncbi:membrane protein [Marinosulfonomonas sp. PRT-SC04]|nr:membrane protein [Marinosulfonomonas sp. PRT-SC04]